MAQTEYTHQACFVAQLADIPNAEKIALGLAGTVKFDSIPCAATTAGSETHQAAITPAKTQFALQFAATMQTGSTPQPLVGVWDDYGITDTEVMVTIAKMYISVIQVVGPGKAADTSRVTQVDALLADNGLVRI